MSKLAATVSLGLALCLLGAGFAASSLYLPGVALVTCAGAGLAWCHAGARRARVVRRVGSTVAQEGVPLPVTVTVTRRGWRPPGSTLRVWPEADPRPVPSGAESTVSTAARFPRRGRHRLGPATLRISDPLELCTRTIASSTDEILVLPRVEPVRAVELDGEPDLAGRSAGIVAEAGATEVDSLRPHRPGAPASRIHWPTVARTTTLIERRLVPDGDEAPLVVIDPRDPADEEALDQAVRAAASLCVHLAQLGACRLLLPGDRVPAWIDAELGGFGSAHVALATVGPEAGAPNLTGVIGAGPVLWVTAAGWHDRLLTELPAAVRYVVSPGGAARWPVHFTVAGCSGRRLDDLRAASAA